MSATLIHALYKVIMSGKTPEEIIQMVTPKLKLPYELIMDIENYNTTYLITIINDGS